MTVPASMTTHDIPTHGGRLAETQGKTLPLESASLRVDARAGLARVVLEQRFKNPHDEALTVTYRMPLPADAAVSGFAFTLGNRRIVGTIDRKAQARERFEEALVQGKSAALLDEETSSLFTQEIGNIPPGAEVVAEITLDQPLTFLPEGAWELRFPLAAAPRYLGAQAPSLGKMTIDVASGAITARASLSMTIGDTLAKGRSPESPSHALQCIQKNGGFEVELGSQNRAELDRDVVIRWPVALPTPNVEIALSRKASSTAAASDASTDVPKGASPYRDSGNEPGAAVLDRSGSMFALCTIVPPDNDATSTGISRDLTLLIDTSGSMQGEPLAQAKRVACALVDSLGDEDTLELFEFSFTTTAFKPQPERANKANKSAAVRWINELVASGGTEMLSGIRAALRDLRPMAQRQIVLITDGLVGFERDVVGALMAGLPPSSRFHALGVGAAANRSLLMPVARAGRGVEAILGVGEDPERAATRLLDRMRTPLVVNLTVTGSALVRSAPQRLPDLFAAAPARIALELKAEGGEVVVRGQMSDGDFVWRRNVDAIAPGTGSEAISKLFARECVEDLEARIAGGESRSVLDHEIEQLGLGFAISTRLTSWIAVTEEATVDPRNPTRREIMPQALPFAMSAEGLGLRAPSSTFSGMLPPISAQSYALGAPPSPGAPRRMRFQDTPPPMGAPMAPRASASRMPAPEQPRGAAGAASSSGKAERADQGEVKDAPAAAPAASPPKEAGIVAKVIGRVRDAFTKGGESADDKSREAVTPQKRVARARLVFSKENEIVIEFDIEGDPIDLQFESGIVTVTLDARNTLQNPHIVIDRSTRSGRFVSGQTLRLVIAIDSPIRDSKDLEVMVDLGNLVVILNPR